MRTKTTVRLSPEAREAVDRLRQAEGRSMASWIEHMIRREAKAKGVWIPKIIKARSK